MSNVINLKEKEKKYIRARDIQKIFNIARSTVDNWAKCNLDFNLFTGFTSFIQIAVNTSLL